MDDQEATDVVVVRQNCVSARSAWTTDCPGPSQRYGLFVIKSSTTPPRPDDLVAPPPACFRIDVALTLCYASPFASILAFLLGHGVAD